MPEAMRLQLEADEDRRLAPWAARSSGATRRHSLSDTGRAYDYRTHYQRDRDRIVYSRAFRRLRQKAQRGILPEYEDHRRNRLTHTLEVGQLARTVCRALSPQRGSGRGDRAQSRPRSAGVRAGGGGGAR